MCGSESKRNCQSSKRSGVYTISRDDAVLIMRDAMEKEFPEDRIADIFAPHRGFSAKMRFVADIDVISVYAVEGQGRGPDGALGITGTTGVLNDN